VPACVLPQTQAGSAGDNMNRIVGCTRVKDGIKYVKRWMEMMLVLCDAVAVVDDGSTDGTTEVLQEYAKRDNVIVHYNQNLPRHGGRDFKILERMIAPLQPDWVFAPDIDEFVDVEDMCLFRYLMVPHPEVQGWTFPFYYLWDNETQYRGDGDYERCHVIRLFRYNPKLSPPDRAAHAQMCSDDLDRKLIRVAPVRIVHLGYMDAEDRERKHQFYTDRDKDPKKAGAGVDSYDHLVQEQVELYPYIKRDHWKTMVYSHTEKVSDSCMEELL